MHGVAQRGPVASCGLCLSGRSSKYDHDAEYNPKFACWFIEWYLSRYSIVFRMNVEPKFIRLLHDDIFRLCSLPVSAVLAVAEDVTTIVDASVGVAIEVIPLAILHATVSPQADLFSL